MYWTELAPECGYGPVCTGGNGTRALGSSSPRLEPWLEAWILGHWVVEGLVQKMVMASMECLWTAVGFS